MCVIPFDSFLKFQPVSSLSVGLSRNGWPPHGVTIVLYVNNLLNPVFEPVKIELIQNHDILIKSIL